MLSRRELLTSAAMVSAAAGSGASAHALTIDTEPAAGLNELYFAAKAACGGQQAYHAQLLADAQAVLGGRELSEEEKRQLLAAMSCPLCGCRLSET